MKIRIAIAVTVLVMVSPAVAETLTPETIILLNKAGIGDEAIVAKIRSSDTVFTLSTDQMIDLRSKGVSGAVIAAMLNTSADRPGKVVPVSLDSPDPAVAHATGVYLLNEQTLPQRMMRIDATVSNQAKTGGILGYALTGGIASLSVKAVIQNETARVKTASVKPVFYMFFDESNAESARSSSAWLSGSAATVTAPSEFSLIGLTRKQGRREARVGSANIGGVKTGVLDKDRIDFDYQLVRAGVYKVSPVRSLTPGEYGFIYAVNGAAAAGAVSARIFDFAVQ